MEEKAARAYDLAALKYWGPSTHINFPVNSAVDLVLPMRAFNQSSDEYILIPAGRLPGGAGGDEEHDEAGVRGSPQKVPSLSEQHLTCS
jgi:hypothetical protein